tara:strand:+ start:124992 stop:127412 length:2421 start_codon:yes stop_codon:yes gene_type:complete
MSEDDSLRQRYLRRFKVGIALLALLSIPAVIHSHAAISGLLNLPPQWVPDSLPEKAEFNDFVRRFSVADVVMIAWPDSDLESKSLDQATALLQPLCEQPDQSLDVELPNWADDAVQQIRTIGDTEQPFRWVRSGTDMLRSMMASPASLSRRAAVARLRGSVVGPDGTQSCLVISITEQGLHHRRELLPLLREIVGEIDNLPAEQIAMAGGPFEGATVDDASVRSIQAFSPPSAIMAAILCFLCLRSIPLTASIVAVAVIGEGLVLAAVYYTGTPMNAVLIVLPPLVFVLTVSSGIHLSNYYIDASHEFPDLTRSGAARRAMRAGVAPCLLATGTTVVGLGSLMLVRLEPIRVFGGVASLGVISTLLLLLLILPGAMVLTRPRSIRAAHDQLRPRGPIRSWFRQRIRARLARPWPLIVGFLLVAGLLATGLTKLETSVNIPRMFLPDSDIRQQYQWFESNLGPTVTGDLTITFEPLAEEDDPLERLDAVKRAHIAAYQLENVDGVLSAMSFVPSIPRGRSLSATATRGVIRKLIRDPESSLGKLAFIHRDDQAEVWRISVRVPQRQDTDYREQIETIRQAVVDELQDSPTGAGVSFTGHVAIVQTAQQVLLHDLFRSFLSAFAVVAVVMMFLLRSVLGGLIAMVPNLFPTVALFGLMGLIRAPLDIGSVMTASVALGIAVDDTVHLLSRFGSRRARGFGQIRAAFGALGQCGWAMFQTTLVCGLSLMAYWFSDFVPTSRFALLMFGLLTAALVGDVFLLPGLMSSSLGRWLSRPVGADPAAKISADQPPPSPLIDFRRLPRRSRRKD